MRYIIIGISLVFLSLFTGAKSGNDSEKSGFIFDQNRRSVRIPVNITHNLVVVPMSINNSPTLNFILDTGVNTTILTEPVIAYAFDFSIDELVLVLGLGSEGVIEAGMARNLKFSLPGITGHNMNMIVLPEDLLAFSEIFGFPIHGILGYDLFREFPIEVNYRRNFIRVYQEPNYRIRRRSKTIPIQLKNNKPYIPVILKGSDQQKIDSLELLVDMGATNPLFLHHTYKFLTDKRIPSYLGTGISGDLQGEVGRLVSLQLHKDIVFRRPLAAYPQEDFLTMANINFQWQGIIGGEILSRFRMIIDYPSEKLILRKNHTFSKPFRANPSGMEIIARGMNFNEFFVSYVRKHSAAYEKGVRVGDQLIAIDYRQASQLSVEEITGILNDSPGTRVRVELLRDTLIYKKTIQLRDDI